MGASAIAGKRSKRSKWAIRLGIAFVIYSVVGFFIVPAIIKAQMLKRLPALTHRQAAIQQVKVNPWSFSLTIRNFSLKEPNGETFASFEQYYVNFQPIASLFRWCWVFRDVSVIKPFLQINYLPDGTFNFSNLIDVKDTAPKKPGPPAPPPRSLIYHLFVTNGAVAIADLNRAEPFRTQFAPIHLDLTNLSTLRNRNSPYSFEARTDDGETFAWKGRVSVNPLTSAGKFNFTGLRFGKYTPYSRDYTRFEIVNGRVNVAADYTYDSATNALDLVLSNASVRVDRLELRSPDTGEIVVNIPSLAVTETTVSAAARTATVGLIKSSGGALLVRREQDGSINLLNLIKFPTNNAAAAAAPAGPLPVAKIVQIAFDDYSLKLEDKQPAKPASFNIDQIAFNIQGVSTVSNAPVSAALSVRFQETGVVTVNGNGTLLPPSADLQIGLSKIDVRAVQPYVEEQLKLLLTGGALDLQGRARYTPSQSGSPVANFTGNLALKKFAATDDVLFKDFVRLDSLTVDGINLDVQPDQLQVDQVKVTGFSASLIVGPDRRPNLQTILRDHLPATTNVAATNAAPEPAPLAAPSPTAKPGLPNVALSTLLLENASIHFADQSLEPHCSFDVQQFGGSITGLSSKPDSTAKVDMQGKVDDRSPFVVSGNINPLARELTGDLRVTFTNTELTAFSPYTEKYAGRPLEKGKLSFAVHYKIDKNVLKSENGFYVDQLTLGAKNNSPDATSLPVKLAIALLKDRNGRIQLDVPVEGRVDDPKFRIGPIIWHVIVNLMVKAATSPFALLGAAFGGGEELSFVEFAPGVADLAESETKKLDTLAKALFERPAVSLEISGSVDPVKDRVPLAHVKLDQQLKSLWLKEQTAAGKPAVPIDQVVLDPDDRTRLIRKVHRETFGRYVPTPPPTNAAATDPNSVAIRLAALPKSVENERGATRLMRSTPASPQTAKPAAAGSPATPAAAATPAAPMSRAELEVADMEDQLAQKMEITNDDLRDLMQQRSNKVQAYLLKTDKVTAERLFIIAPRAIGPGFKAEDRANLSLN